MNSIFVQKGMFFHVVTSQNLSTFGSLFFEHFDSPPKSRGPSSMQTRKY